MWKREQLLQSDGLILVFDTCTVTGEAVLSHYYVTGFAVGIDAGGIDAGVVACLCGCAVLFQFGPHARVNLSDCVGVYGWNRGGCLESI